MEELEKKLAELESQFAQLMEENRQFKEREKQALQKQYDELANVISRAIEQGDKLESDYKNLRNAMKKDDLLIKLSDANNPNSDILGFKFTKVVSDAVTRHFTQNITNQDVKDKFGEIVNRVVNNPVVAAILTTNPVTGMVYRVIDKITDFTTNNPLGMRLKKWNQETKGVFQEDRMEGFRLEMTTYIDFFDLLLKASAQYNHSLESLEQKNNSLSQVLKNYYSALLEDLGVNIRSGTAVILQVQKILQPTASADDLRSILEKENVIAAYKKAQEFASIKERYENLRIDYNNIVVQFLQAYLEAFEKTEHIEKEYLDRTKLGNLINQIKSLMKELKEGG